MIDIFLQEDMQKLLKNKSVVLMGDSNIRALYKDFLCLLRSTQFISDKRLKTKMENSCFGDKLVYHGEKSNGREYREERTAKIDGTSLSFFFLTRVYDNYVRKVLENLKKNGIPDILIVNSCVWDVTRWGPSGVEEFKINLKHLMKQLKLIMPDCLVIWVTTPPIAVEMKGGFLLKELQFLKYSLRFHVVEANHYARKILVQNGFDVLDSHYHLKMQIHRRSEDGIHWLPAAVRYVTNLLLTHISLAFNQPLPHRYKSEIMEQNLEAVLQQDEISVEVSNAEVKGVKSKVVAPPSQDENFNSNAKTPKPKEKKPRLKSPCAVQPQLKNSHHAYLSRVQNRERRNRIRQWQQATGSPRSFLPLKSPPSRYRFQSMQHDSGYLSPGLQVSISDTSLNPDFTCYPSQSPLCPPPYNNWQRPGLYALPPVQQSYLLPTPSFDFTSNSFPSSFVYF